MFMMMMMISSVTGIDKKIGFCVGE